MRWLRRSAPSSIVSSSSRVAPGVKSTSRCSKLLTDALIDDNGVRRSCDTAASSAVRSSFASSSPSTRAASARERALLHRDPHLARERLQDLEVFEPEIASAQDEHVVSVQRDAEISDVRSRRRGCARLRHDHPVGAVALGEDRDRVGVERDLYLRHELGKRVGRRGQRAAQRRERLRLGPGLRGFGGATGSRRHEEAHHSRDEQEDHQREQVLTLLDRELVVRRREVPIGEQEARDRGTRTRG